MSADSTQRQSRVLAAPAIVPPQVVSDRSILDSAIGFISDVTLAAHQPNTEPKDTIIWARFETAADISDPCYGDDWEIEGNVTPPLLLALGYGMGVQMWAIPANGEAIEVLSWRHGVVSTLRVLPTSTCARASEDHGRADETIDLYAEKRPLIALVDSSTAPTGPQPQFCSLNFVSLKTGKQVKTIKFKNPILDVLANRSSVVAIFHERIAIFDAYTLDDRLSITTCYPSPGINPNPVTLGQRWLAYAEHRLIPSIRSGGGWDGEGISSYTATVLNAAKSFSKGLRELGEQVAAGLTGTSSSGTISKTNSFDSPTGVDIKQPGIITIMDIKHSSGIYSPTVITAATGIAVNGFIVAHFIAHSEAVVAMEFDNSGMLLLTADRRGHDFHVFRVQPHPVSSSLAAVHHLYVLHRGDTSAKVQNISFSLDSRWAAISTLRGTTHVFPITPYGGPMGVRTHTSLHVVNKLSRFHRSAGLSGDGRSNSPISHSESTTFVQSLQPYHNPTLPPFPRPIVVLALAQLRQPFTLGSPSGSAGLGMAGKISGTVTSNASQRQRHSSLSDDNGKPLSVCAIFAKSRSWLLEPPNLAREAPHRIQRKAVDSLFVMAGHGALIQYDLDTKLASNIAKEKIGDDTPIELVVEAKAQWNLGRRRDGSHELMPPLASDNWLLKDRNVCMLTDSIRQLDDFEEQTESWVSQVEIITHAGPHRRLWMGPQCIFKTYNTPSGSNLNHVDVEAVEIGVSKPASAAAAMRSHPLSMPVTAAARCALPVLIESGSYSSIEQSPKLMDRFRHEHLDSDFAVGHGDMRLKEDLADAMRESRSITEVYKNSGRLASEIASSENVPFYDAREDPEIGDEHSDLSPKSLAQCLPFSTSSSEMLVNLSSWNLDGAFEKNKGVKLVQNKLKRESDAHKPSASVEKVVNPLGTVTTVISGLPADVKTDILDEVASQLAAEGSVIHENCDESLFRPVVTIFCDDKKRKAAEEEGSNINEEFSKPTELIKNKLIVPVIAKEIDAELCKQEKNQKSCAKMKLQNRKNYEGCADQKKPNVISVNYKNQVVDVINLKAATSQQNEQLGVDHKKRITDKYNKDDIVLGTLTEPLLKKVAQQTNSLESCNIDMCTPDNKKDIGRKKDVIDSIKNLPPEHREQKPIPVENIRKQGKTAEIKWLNQEKGIEAHRKLIGDDDDVMLTETKKIAKTNVKSVLPHKDYWQQIEKRKQCEIDNIKNAKSKSGTPKYETAVFEIPENRSKKQAHNFPIPGTKELCALITNSEGILHTTSEKGSFQKNNEIPENSYFSEHTETSIGHNFEMKMDVPTEREVYALNISKMADFVDNVKKIPVNDVLSSSDTNKSEGGTKDKTDSNTTDIITVNNTTESKKITFPEEKGSIGQKPVQFDKKESKKSRKTDIGAVKSFKKESLEIRIGSNLQPYLQCPKRQPEDNSNKRVIFDAEGEQEVMNENVTNINKDFKVKSTAKKFSETPSPSIQADTIGFTKKIKSNATETDNSKCKQEIKVKKASNHTTLLSLESKTEYYPVKPSVNSVKSAWKTVASSVEAIQNMEHIPRLAPMDSYPSLDAVAKVKKLSKIDQCRPIQREHILSDISTKSVCTQELEELNPVMTGMSEVQFGNGFGMISPPQRLEVMPPIPALDNLNISPLSTILEDDSKASTTVNKDVLAEQFSLINFESPLQEIPAIDRKSTTIEQSFSQQNLTIALCGSLHYENESDNFRHGDTSPANSHLLSMSAQADNNSRTEDEEQYLSLEQNSQETNTNNTATTNEKSSSSANSSVSEEIVVLEEKKLSRKQRRKRQQMDLKKQKNESATNNEDEELRPLIGITDSQVEIMTAHGSDVLSTPLSDLDKKYHQSLVDEGNNLNPVIITSASPLACSTTIGSEGQMPVTTSDDNVFILPSKVTTPCVPIKLKTKKIEHKINLIAAIDAAMSSSTSSTEESNVEVDNREPISDQEVCMPEVSTSQAQPNLTDIGLAASSCAAKKKTKRRKR